MTWRSTLILGLVFVCAAAGWFADRALTKKRALVKEREKALFSIIKEDVNAFTLVNPTGTYRLEKKDGKWTIMEPRRLPADQDQAESLMTNLGVAKQYDPVETSDLAQYGLDNPPRRIALEDRKSGRKETLLVGLESTTPGRFFAMIEGGKTVFTVAGHIKTFMDKNLYHLRDKTVFSVKKDAIKSVEILRDGISAAIKKANGDWIIARPRNDRADAAAMANFLSAIETLRAASFEDDIITSPGFYGFENPQAILFVEADKATTLVIGREDTPRSRYFARLKGEKQIVTIPGNFVDEISGVPDNLRSRSLFSFGADDIQEIKIIVGESYASIEKGNDGVWKFHGDEKTPVNQGRVRRLLGDIASLKVLSFEEENPVSLGRYGLADPKARLIVYPKDRKTREILSLGDKAEGRDIVYAGMSDRPSVFGIDWTRLGDFYLTKRDLEDRRIFRLEPASIQRVEMIMGGISQILVHKGARWFAEKDGKLIEVDEFKAAAVLKNLLGLQSSMEIQESEKVSAALSKPSVEIQFFDETGKETGAFAAAESQSPDATIKTNAGKFHLIKRSDLQKLMDAFNALFEKEPAKINPENENK